MDIICTIHSRGLIALSHPDGGYTIEVGVMMDLTKEMEALTNQITESSPILSPREPTKQEVDEAVAALDLCVGDDDW